MNTDRFKFRAGYENPNGKIVLHESDEHYPDWFWKTNRKVPYDTPIMQSTGLRDKNGLLIFEGDILLLKASMHFKNYEKDEYVKDFNDFKEFNEKLLVAWDDDRACFNIFTWRGEDIDINTVEILGNIHEHPELLEKGND